LHSAPECVELAERRRAFARALKVPGPLDPTAVREYVASARNIRSTAQCTGTEVHRNTSEHPTGGTPQEM